VRDNRSAFNALGKIHLLNQEFSNILEPNMLSGISMTSNVTGSVMAESAQILQAFTDDHVVRLTGLTKGQLRSWDRREFFAPQYGYEERGLPYSRIYSFRDVVGLRTISKLMKEHRVSLQQLRKAAIELVRRGYSHWADTKIYVLRRKVYFQPPGEEHAESIETGQLAMVPIIDVILDVKERVRALNLRGKDKRGKVEQHKFIARNAPVIAGTRIPTASIRRFREDGYTIEQIAKQYPSLTLADVKAALAFERKSRRKAA
jgi:uncharacterized protein (DUF433 family)/DNA-binding transcriptional MerR regulator